MIFRQHKLLINILLISILFGCSSSPQHGSVSPADDREQLIIGKWKLQGSDECWVQVSEYKPNGEKYVTMDVCMEGAKVALWYKATWSISGEFIIENLTSMHPILKELDFMQLPHVDTDTLHALDKNTLVIINENYPDEKSVYSRLE